MFFEGLCGQPNAKKPKIIRQSLDNPFDNIVPMTNSIPSPAASQMSNMSNPNKFIKIISGRDRARKTKALKVNFNVKLDAHVLANFLSFILLILLFIYLLFFPIRFLLHSLFLEVLGPFLKIRLFGIHLLYHFFSVIIELNKYFTL